MTSLASDATIDVETADGLILIPLCETEEERQGALRFVTSPSLLNMPYVLVAVPHPLNNLAPMVHELHRWEWVMRNTPELNHDPYAAEEVSRQIAASRRVLEQRLQDFLGVQQSAGHSELQWFRQGQRLELRSGPELLSYLSHVCDTVYPLAPKITNELLNRRSLSSAAAAARMRLIEQVLNSPTEAFLGMDARKKPPEMAMYLSVLKKGRLHREINGAYAFVEPDVEDDPCRVRPALQQIRQILQAHPDERVPVIDVFMDLRRPPFGLRDGVIPLLLAVFITINEQNIALYENGSFLHGVSGFDFLRLTKAPETFDIQFYQTSGVRTKLFESLLVALHQQTSNTNDLNVLDIVRPLAVFAANLPVYTQKTQQISIQAQAVRTVLMEAREPATLLFRDLPLACGFGPLVMEGDLQSDDVEAYVAVLQAVMDELRAAYSQLLKKIKAQGIKVLDISDDELHIGMSISARAKQLLIVVHEPRLKGFCMRLSDDQLPEEDWLVSLGSFVCSKPPSKWSDLDTERFSQDFVGLCARFKRMEAISFSSEGAAQDSLAYRIAITRSDGAEVDQVLYLTPDEVSQISHLEAHIVGLLQGSNRLGLAAASRALWKLVCEE